MNFALYFFFIRGIQHIHRREGGATTNGHQASAISSRVGKICLKIILSGSYQNLVKVALIQFDNEQTILQAVRFRPEAIEDKSLIKHALPS